MWAKVISILKKDNNFGSTLALCCPRHPKTPIDVSKPDDFSRLAPEGGCSLKCDLRLSCGHSCSFKCHSQPRHDGVICQEPCPRSRESCGHACAKVCGVPCAQLCLVQVKDVQLPCGHIKDSLECHKTQDVTVVKCHQIVRKKVPGCGHSINTECCINPAGDSFECQAVCADILPCGHSCLKPCHECKTREGAVLTADHGKCLEACGRLYSTCAHLCKSICHGDEPCPLCEQPCDVRCSHSRCGKKCQEPCAPCAERCSWECAHHGRCTLPCAVPCDLLPCSSRCTKLLTCGHQCPSVCGEICPPEKYCHTCAPDEVKDMMVDYIECLSYREMDVDEYPVIVPLCGHIMSLASMDGTMEIQEHYDMAEDGTIRKIKSTSQPFSTKSLKSCPICRFPLRNIHRYNRIVKRGLLDQATQRFIVWANAKFVPLEAQLYSQEERLKSADSTLTASRDGYSGEHLGEGMQTIRIERTRDDQIRTIRRLSGLDVRYTHILRVRKAILVFFHQVSEEEQPYSRVHRMVKNVRDCNGTHPTFEFDGSVLQVRSRLLTTVLALRCDLAILSDFLNVYQTQSGSRASQHKWLRSSLILDLSYNRRDCTTLLKEALMQQQPMHAIEAHVFYARFVALERSVPTPDAEKVAQLLLQAHEGLDSAKKICASARSTGNMLAEIEDAEKLLRGSTFYTTFTNDEKRAVYAAMAQELRGTGHWYYCQNGHPVRMEKGLRYYRFKLAKADMHGWRTVYGRRMRHADADIPMPAVRCGRRRTEPPTC